jgi:signal transduction histidine kinase
VLHQCDGRGSWDPDRIAQLLVNLITNAFQYGSPTEPVVITVRGDEEQVVIDVSNQGAPIPPDVLPKLFEPLQRGRKSSTERSIGLGLYIVQEIAKQHGGFVVVDSSEDAGTTFSVQLPRHAAALARD